MGEDGSRSSAPVSFQSLNLKAPPDRLYGRSRGHQLRPRQQRLLDVTLPRLRLTASDLPPSACLEVRSLFARVVREVWVEIGFGAGEHAQTQVDAHPDIGLIACEVFENGISSLLSRLVPDGAEASAPLPPNLRLWPEDGRLLLRALPDAAVDRLFLLFPDPWPKPRHAKRRFVHPANLPLVARVLRPGATWRVATDDPTYQEWVRLVMAGQTLFDAAPPVAARPDGWPPTRYEAKALREGRRPLYWTFRRR